MADLTWTAADLDSAASESGVVHESVTNTDHTNASELKMGYSVESPLYPTGLVAYWPHHEDSGTVANDVTGNGNDGEYQGATLGQTGLLGTTAPSFDGVGDRIYVTESGSQFSFTGGPFTVLLWFNAASITDDSDMLIAKADPNNHVNYQLRFRNSSYLVEGYDGAWKENEFGSHVTGEWVMIAAGVDSADTLFGMVQSSVDNGTKITGNSVSGLQTNNEPLEFGREYRTDRTFNGRYGGARFYNRELTASEFQDLYDIVAAPASLRTGSKVS